MFFIFTSLLSRSLSLTPTIAVHLRTMATPVVLPTLLMALPLLPLTRTDMVPLLPQEVAATVVTLPIHLTPMVEVGVTMVGVAMALPLLAAVVATMGDTRSR